MTRTRTAAGELREELTAADPRFAGATVHRERVDGQWAILVRVPVPDAAPGAVMWGGRRPELADLLHDLRTTGIRHLAEDLDAAVAGRPLTTRVATAVVLDPLMAAVVVHECIGHTSEADNIARYGNRLGLGLGDRWCPAPLNVTDDPTRPRHCGSYLVDDDGIPARPTRLVVGGRWTGVLGSLAVPGTDGGSTGHGRRQPGAGTTLPRNGVLITAAGDTPAAGLVSAMGDGFLLGGPRHAGSVDEFVVVRAAWARVVRAGRLTGEVRTGLVLRARKADLMRHLVGIGDRMTIADPYHRCAKDGQEVPVTMGAPHLAFDRLVVYPAG